MAKINSKESRMNAGTGNKKGGAKDIIKSALIVLISAFFGAGVQIFVMIPCGMTSGGLPGVVRLITHFLPSLSYSVIYYTFSMVILIIAYLTMGKAEVGRIVALAFAYPVLLFIFEHIDFELLDSPDPLLASLLIGVCYGVATGIGYIGGFSSGGTDTIARILKYKVFNHLRVGDIQMAIDVTIILISAFVFNTNVAFYAVINAVVAAKVISMVMLGVNGRYVQFDVISSKPEEITQYVLNEVNRAVTSHASRGEYTKAERRTLTVICTPNESIKIKNFIAEIDPNAFATVMPISTVWGKRFADITKVDNV
ncbi:MAG: YitT family protein [Clostridiales bacterium]|nr:YitT family protein [Clostridiales bacterium]